MRKSDLIWLALVAIALTMASSAPALLALTSPISPLPPDDGIEWTYCINYVYIGAGVELVCSDTMPDLPAGAQWRCTVCRETTIKQCTKTWRVIVYPTPVPDVSPLPTPTPTLVPSPTPTPGPAGECVPVDPWMGEYEMCVDSAGTYWIGEPIEERNDAET
jgi:hypothetical protein